jgi:tetratricopeptide (TPR) repeat protein
VKVAVYAIALNEEQFVSRWAESAKDSDFLLIADTGSTDRTVELAKELGINVISIGVSPWRFDVARNAALANLPLDIDYCISLDMDEVLCEGWRDALEGLAESGITRPRHTFTFSFNDDGSPAYQFGGNRIHSRQGYFWKHPIHEVLTPYGVEETQSWIDLEIQHHPDRTKSRSQYLPLLEQATKDEPQDARMAFYYGRELYYYGQKQAAISQLNTFLQLPSATWRGDRSDALILIARCSADLTEATRRAEEAIAEAPDRREGYVYLSRLFYEQQKYAESLAAAEQALSITERPLQYMCEDWAWNWEPWDIAAISAYNIGNLEDARMYGSIALQMNESNQRLQDNLKYYSE